MNSICLISDTICTDVQALHLDYFVHVKADQRVYERIKVTKWKRQQCWFMRNVNHFLPAFISVRLASHQAFSMKPIQSNYTIFNLTLRHFQTTVQLRLRATVISNYTQAEVKEKSVKQYWNRNALYCMLNLIKTVQISRCERHSCTVLLLHCLLISACYCCVLG